MGEVEDIERPLARLEQRPPRRFLEGARASAGRGGDGGAPRARVAPDLARATRVSQARVRRIIERLGDSRPPRVRAANGTPRNRRATGTGLGGGASRYRIVGASVERTGAVAAGVG
jgi:hypothetical protein